MDVGDFVVENETLLFIDPDLTTEYVLCLEYLEKWKQCVVGDHILFTLDLSPAPSTDDCLFVDHPCVHMGFERVGSPSDYLPPGGIKIFLFNIFMVRIFSFY